MANRLDPRLSIRALHHDQYATQLSLVRLHIHPATLFSRCFVHAYDEEVVSSNQKRSLGCIGKNIWRRHSRPIQTQSSILKRPTTSPRNHGCPSVTPPPSLSWTRQLAQPSTPFSSARLCARCAWRPPTPCPSPTSPRQSTFGSAPVLSTFLVWTSTKFW